MSSDKIPFLPGLTQHQDPLKRSHNLKHTFDFKNGIPIDRVTLNGAALEEIEPMRDTRFDHKEAERAKGLEKSFEPHFVTYNNAVLRFHAQIVEMIDNKPELRKFFIDFHLEDEMTSIYEPKRTNSGMMQGTFLRKGKYLNWTELKVDSEVTLFGRTFYVYGCDEFTRNFYESVGLSQNADVDVDEKPIEEVIERPTVSKSDDKRGLFLKNDRKVLRFWLTWDTTKEPFGRLRHFTLHYFLADKTTEVYENEEDGSLPFLRKNVLLQPEDIRTGETVNVFGRIMQVHYCDAFTHQWYLENMQLEQEMPPVEQEEENTIEQVDEKNRREFTWRFTAVLEQEPDRNFVIHLFTDDKISIFEVAERNSGYVGGKFLERYTGAIEGELKIGEKVVINSFTFILVDADQKTLEVL
ncbi:hypothetical protein PCE1_004788 [Barthelona sp. PCE]